eukprot:CAMPEP_0182853046 /NCGR_PEP_ID=MMETSP0034_2-20130328/488_1 /TAXON_ID=156128 /ORGANISM="Nephroselmis pyriformis, Strain CCMP717" /LENGTH=493 /DNA_ID=CAMNT_0024983793 /DNA_START=9 /DNA_END=1488 /DNA_ORIENTATION=+
MTWVDMAFLDSWMRTSLATHTAPARAAVVNTPPAASQEPLPLAHVPPPAAKGSRIQESKNAMSTQVIVIGGGLAGLSAAHTVIEHGGRVVVLDKMAFMGGNSTKATSGINGALTKTQIAHKIPDSADIFEQDCIKSAAGLGHTSAPEYTVPLAKVLAQGSGSAVDWLMQAFNLDLSLVSQLGGHSQPRTHRGKEKFPGFTITYALMEKLEEIEKATNGQVARIICKARVTELHHDASGAVNGVTYVQDGKNHRMDGPVIIATGGFAADFEPNGILMRVRPDLAAFPTTNGEHCTGDGIKMAEAVGAGTVDMESVQVHPTGLVNPEDPDEKVKFLAAEALRGVGGILIDANGKRFCDELGRRDYVSGEMYKNKGPFRLVLNSKASAEILWHCKHYIGRGVMKYYNSGHDLAKDMNISPQVLSSTFKQYNEVARTGRCPYGKKFFHNVPLDINDNFHVSWVTPIVHYCMGGLHIDENSQVLRGGQPIEGCWAAGE